MSLKDRFNNLSKNQKILAGFGLLLLFFIAASLLTSKPADAQLVGRGGDASHYYIVRAVDADTGRSLGAANLSSLPPLGYYWITPDRKRCLIVEGEVRGQPSGTASAANVAQATVKVRCGASKPAD